MIEELNIPIYRALDYANNQIFGFGFIKDVGSDEEDIICTHNPNEITGYEIKFTKIQADTKSIHFSDMIANDSNRLLPNGEKDLRIFASLCEDGKGGDRLDELLPKGEFIAYGVATYDNCKFAIKWKSTPNDICDLMEYRKKQSKIIGIQK